MGFKITGDASSGASAAKDLDKALADTVDRVNAFTAAARNLETVSDEQASSIQQTLGIYRSLSSALKDYTSSVVQTEAVTDKLGQSSRNSAVMLDQMGEAVAKLAKGTQLTDEQIKAMSGTLKIYQQLAVVKKEQEQANLAEARALQVLAQAEREAARAKKDNATAALTDKKTAALPTSAEARAAREMAEERKVEAQYTKEAQVAAEEKRRASVAASREEVAASQKIVNEKRAEAIESQKQNQQSLTAARLATEEGRAKKIAADQAAAAKRAESAEMDRHLQKLAQTRYALYEVQTVYQRAALVASAIPVAMVGAAASYEQAFAQVARTTQASEQQLGSLSDGLRNLATEIPASFQDLSGIASLGAQMGIASQDLESFTDTVARFSATTNVSTEQAAMAFGRLANMTGITEHEFQNLGSAVSELGTASVATESEILAVAQGIATTTTIAGYGADETVGLATALASLKIPPELARGGLLRVFNIITSAVAEGGEALDGFAAQLGITAAEAETLWRTDAPQFFDRLLQSLSGVKDDAVAMQRALADLGIKNTRDLEVIRRLANGYDVVGESMALASKSYEQGTYLMKESGPIFDTLISRLTMLKNAFMNFMAGAGEGFLPILKPVIELLTNLFEGLANAPTAFKVALAALSLGAAAFLGLRSAIVTTQISLIAFQQVMGSGLKGQIGTIAGLRSVYQEAFGRSIPASVGAATASLRGFAVAANQAGVAAASAAGGGAVASMGARIGGTAGYIKQATSALSGLGTAIKGIGSVAGLTFGIWAATAAWEAFSNATMSAEARFDKSIGTFEGLSQAIAADTQTYNNGGEALALMEMAAGSAASAQDGLASSVRGATDEVDNQIVALGEQTSKLLAQQLSEGLTGGASTGVTKILADLKVDWKQYTDLLVADAANGTNNAWAYIQPFYQKLRDEQAKLSAENREGLFGPIAAIGDTSGSSNVAEAANRLESLSAASDGLRGDLEKTMFQADITANSLGIVGEVAEETGGDFDNAAAGAANMGETMFASVSGLASIEGALYNLGGSLQENGVHFGAYSEAGRANLEALQSTVQAMATASGDDVGAFTANLYSLVDSLQSYGVDVEGELGFLWDQLVSLSSSQFGIDLDSSAARGSISAFIADAIRAIQVRAQLERAATAARVAAANATGNPILASVNVAAGVAAQTVYSQQLAGLQKVQSAMATSGNVGKKAGNSIAQGYDNARRAADRAGGAGRKAGRDAGQGAREAQKEIRTLADYANDLGTVFKRAFEIQFGPEQALDDTADAWTSLMEKMATADKAVVDARQSILDINQAIREQRVEIQGLNAELQSLAADNAKLSYQLSVATEYGDDLRATQIRAEMAENNAKVAETETKRAAAQDEVNKKQRELTAAGKDLSQAEQDAKRSLDGTTASSRDQRGAVLQLVQSYGAQIQALASSGLSTDELNRRTAALKAEFVRNLTQMGYNRAEVGRYASAFDSLTLAINKVPRNITVAANTNPAQQALNEFVARNQGRTIQMRANVSSPGSIGGGAYNATGINVGAGGVNTPKINTGSGGIIAPKMNIAGQIQYGGSARPVAIGGPIYRAAGGVAGMHPGGPIGSDTVPAWLTPGEFVIRKSAVDLYGLDFFNALNRKQYSPGPQVIQSAVSGLGGGIQLVELLPHQIQQIVDAVQVSVNLNGNQIAASTNSSNTQSYRRGSA